MNRLKSGWLLGSALALVATSAYAKNYTIAPGDLGNALNIYQTQSGVMLVVADNAIRGVQTTGVEGDYTADQALIRLLKGTGFTYARDSSGVVAIVPAKNAEPEKIAQAAPRHTPAAPPPQQAVETVVVTAQHKSEDIQQVPISITALSQQQLTERQIAGGPDLVKEVPNLTFTKTNFTGYNLEIRGIGTQAISVATDPAVAVAFNSTPFIRNHFFEQEFYDLQDVEVLRGPQGTLYGRNATAGVVNLKSALPTDQYEAMLSADIGNYSNRRLEGMLNLPLVGDTLDLRIAGEWTKRDGYTTDTTTNTSVDGRDLWSGRVTLGWKPASNVQSYLVWEHFSEDDDRLRSGKQLCEQAPTPTVIAGQYGSYAFSVPVTPPSYGNSSENVLTGADFLSQGCLPSTSLYAPTAFQVPNPYSLPYYTGPLYGVGYTNTSGIPPYSPNETQSTNLRQIQSEILPTYRAKNDTLEYNVDWTISRSLTFTSQTGYNQDFLWSTEDYNRFGSNPGFFTGTFCDPQLGCSDRLMLEDLSQERAWQASQEFRLASNFDGPLNFSAGANYLHYETVEDYYVFVNSVTGLSYLYNIPVGTNNRVFSGDNSNCLLGGFRYPNPTVPNALSFGCPYVDTNPIGSLNGQGHNYFLSQNPYVLNSYAMFGELYYNIAKNLKLTAGLRWTDDQKHFLDIPSELLLPGYGYPVTAVVNQSWERPTGRMVLDWTPDLNFTDQTLIYASAAHGYKAGGANPPGALYPTSGQFGNTAIQTTDPIHPLTFKPEYIESFELGTKNTLLGNTLTLNGDIFYYNYTGYQISEIVDRSAINLNFNAHVEGGELEANWEPLPGLKFSLAQGFENTALAGGDQAVDLMDRTAGNPNWIVVKPTITEASNCILPTYVVATLLGTGDQTFALRQACDEAYNAHVDPVTDLTYTAYPSTGGVATPGVYPGFNPLTAPNNGAGFDKNVAGNQLPNAPHFTTSLTAEYTLPVSDDWAATLHTDFYWQSQQWARVFEDPIDKIHGYSNVNLSLILTSDNGWQVMGYVKNVFDTTAITGTFLNSDDTGLTTNVFLTDPRLYGVRVTKHLDENDGFWGSDWSGAGWIKDIFSDSDNGKPSLWIEFGGGFDFLEDSQQAFAPSWLADVTEPKQMAALTDQHPPSYALDQEAKVTWQPDGSDWVFSGGVRFGRSSSKHNAHQQTPNGEVQILPHTVDGLSSLPPYEPQFGGYSVYPHKHVKFADALSQKSESHTILDFLVGKEVGLGMFGMEGSSTLSGGIRVAQFISKSSVNLTAVPDLHYPTGQVATYAQKYKFLFNEKLHFHNFTGSAVDKETFRGLGPELAWNASAPVAGSDAGGGQISVDWGANFSMLFGRQTSRGSHKTVVNSYYVTRLQTPPPVGTARIPGAGPHRSVAGYGPCSPRGTHVVGSGATRGVCAHHTKTASHNRSRMVAIPNIGALFGLSYKYQNAKISFGYRADEFFGAMDGGIDTHKAYNRSFNGPYATLSIGLGG